MPDVRSIRRFWHDNAYLGAATLSTGLANWGYAVLLARHLGPIGYGDLIFLNNWISVGLLPLPAVTLWTIRHADVRVAPRRLWIVGALVGALEMAVYSLWSGHPRSIPVELVGLFSLAVPAYWGYAVAVGRLERARAYRRVAGLMMISGLGTVTAAFAAIHVPREVSLTVLGLMASALAWGLWGVAGYWIRPRVPAPFDSRAVRGGITVIAGFLGSLWSMGDAFLAKILLTPEAAGWYAGLNTVGQALPFVAGSLLTVMLTGVLDRPAERRAVIRRTQWLLAGITVVYGALVVGLPHTVVIWALGPRFRPVAGWLPVYGAAMMAETWALYRLMLAILDQNRTIVLLALGGTMIWLGRLVITRHQFVGFVGVTVQTFGVTWAAIEGAAFFRRQKARHP